MSIVLCDVDCGKTDVNLQVWILGALCMLPLGRVAFCSSDIRFRHAIAHNIAQPALLREKQQRQECATSCYNSDSGLRELPAVVPGRKQSVLASVAYGQSSKSLHEARGTPNDKSSAS